jgi:2-polyprenyl-3-methyl-5-hydroxy-6-metoxy-1,4-benzoquinol methylase
MTQRFDQEAATWDENPRRIRLAKAVAQTIIQQVSLSGAMDVLDFGCGTGLLTLRLQPLVGTITGADTSPGMLEVMAGKLKGKELENVSCSLLPSSGSAMFEGIYDLIVSNMTLHHVQDLAALFRAFSDHLRAGGHVALADLDQEDGTFHGEVADVFHLGFHRGALKGLLASAGFVDLEDTTAYEIRRNGRDYPVFLVTGRKGG